MLQEELNEGGDGGGGKQEEETSPGTWLTNP